MQAARDKIREFKAKLKTAKRDKIDVKERQKWRNVVSAQQSRLKKKQEVRFLNSVIRRKDDGIETLLQIVGEELELQGQNGLLANILRRAQREIQPVDNETVNEYNELQAILDDFDIPDEEPVEEVKPKRRRRSVKKEKPPKVPFSIPDPRRFNGGPSTNLTEFCDVIGDYLISSETVLSKFQHNDEKDDKDYEKEASKSTGKKK